VLTTVYRQFEILMRYQVSTYGRYIHNPEFTSHSRDNEKLESMKVWKKNMPVLQRLYLRIGSQLTGIHYPLRFFHVETSSCQPLPDEAQDDPSTMTQTDKTEVFPDMSWQNCKTITALSASMEKRCYSKLLYLFLPINHLSGQLTKGYDLAHIEWHLSYSVV
jgi:hypothetical protein